MELTNAAAGATGVDLDATFATDAELAAAADDDISSASYDAPTNVLTINEGASFVTADLSDLDDSAGVAANAANIATNTADIATNTADIATNTADIATNTADIATNTADIATNTADIATNTADIATNTADIATNTTDIATNAADIATHIANDNDTDDTNELSDLQLTVTTLELTNAAAGATGVDLDATFATDAELAAAADDDISSASYDAPTNVLTINEGASFVTADLSDLDDSAGVAANAANIATNTADIATNTADIATNTADIATNTADIATNTADIATNTADIATNTADIATNTADIATNTTDIATNAADIATHIANDNDTDDTNEYNTGSGIAGGVLSVTDGGGTESVDLISIDANNDLGFGTDGALYLNVASVSIAETNTTLSFNSGTSELTYTNELGNNPAVDISSLDDSAGVAANAANIATNATNIATNTADIATNTADIATNTADIATNTADIATNTADIATNAADIATHIANDNDTDDTNELSDLQLTVTTLELTNAAAGATGVDLDATFATDAELAAAADDDISSASYDAPTNVLTINEGASFVTADLSDLDDSAGVAANAANIATNTANIATNTADIATNTADIATNTADIATNTADIATNTADIATNTADIATNTADIATNTADIATNTADIATHIANDNDTDDTNELSDLQLTVTTLELTNAAAGATGVDLDATFATDAELAAAADDDISSASYDAPTNVLTINEGASFVTADLSDLDDSAGVAANAANIATNTADIATNTADIATNTADIATNTADIATNTADIATNTADIATNAADIATNTANIATNTADIATNTADIATNTADIATNTADIATNTADIATNTADIATNTADIATNTADIATNTADIATNTADIATNTADIATNTADIATNAADIATHIANDNDTDDTNEYNTGSGIAGGVLSVTDGGGTESVDLISIDANNDLGFGTDGALYLNVASVSIAETNTTLSFNSGTSELTYTNELGNNPAVDISSLDDSAGVAANAANIATNTADIATNTADIATNTADIATNTADIATNTADIATNTADIATNTADIATNTADIATNTADIATNTADIATNTADIATNTADIATNTADIATNTADIATNTADIATNTTDIATNAADIATHIANDNDTDDTNEYNTGSGIAGGVLSVTDGGGTESVDLISIDANNDLGFGTDGALYLNVASVSIAETNTTLSFNSGTSELTYANELGNNPAVDISSLDDSAGVAANAANIATNTADIATNTADIATNTADIATNTADIATNTADIATNTADIATNTADIATNTADIATNAADIATHIANDNDTDDTNELSDLQLTVTTLELTNAAAGATGVDLDATFATDAELAAAADDDISSASYDAPTNVLTINEGASFVTADLSDLDDSAGVAANAANIATNTADIATNTADIATNTADIATNTADIATNTADIATNTADIATNTADIATNTADIATNTADIATNTADIATNTADIATNTADIATNTADITTNAADIATNTADIATNTADIATNTADIATNTADIATNTADIATNTADIATNAADIATHIANDNDTDDTNELSDLQLTSTTLELTNAAAGATGVDLDATFATDAELAAAADDDISSASYDAPTNVLTINEGASFVTADLSDLDDSAGVAANAANIATNTADIATNTADIATNTADIATNTADIATNTADIATNTADIATNTADIATNTADIATNTADIATNTADIATNAADIATHIANDNDTDDTNELSDLQLTVTTLELTNAAAGATGVDLDATFATDAELAAAADDDISSASYDAPTNVLTINEGASFVTADLSDLDDSAGVAANAANIATNTADIATNTADIATNTADIATNTADIATNTADIATNTADIATNTADIATNTADIATNTADIATNTADIATNTADIATNAADIATHIANDNDTDDTNELSDLQLTSTTLELTNAAAGATGVDLDATFATDAELAAAADDDISSASYDAPTNVLTINEGASFVTADLSDLDDSAGVAANAANIATNTADIATNTADIATNTADIATNTADIATNTADIASNTADIATNTADIATNTADIATNAADIATNTADIATNAADIATHIASDNDTDDTNELSDLQLTSTTLELTNAAAGATGVDLDATFATDAELAAAADDDVSVTNTVTGNRIATISETGITPVDINETVTSLSQNTSTGVISYTDEDGGAAETANVVSTNTNNLISAGTDGGAFLSMPTIYSTGKVGGNGTAISIYQATSSRIDEGDYQITFTTALPNANYIIQLVTIDCGGDCPGNTGADYDDPGITYYDQQTTGFKINIGDSDNGATQKDDIDLEFMYTVITIPN